MDEEKVKKEEGWAKSNSNASQSIVERASDCGSSEEDASYVHADDFADDDDYENLPIHLAKKEWYDIRAPSFFTTRNVGENLVSRTQGTKERAYMNAEERASDYGSSEEAASYAHDDDVANSQNHSSLDPDESANFTQNNEHNGYGATILTEIERTMKKHADILLHSLEGVHVRLSELESRTRNLENLVDDFLTVTVESAGCTDGKLWRLENYIREVLRDKREIAEAQLHLAKRQASKLDQQPEIQSSQQPQQQHVPVGPVNPPILQVKPSRSYPPETLYMPPEPPVTRFSTNFKPPRSYPSEAFYKPPPLVSRCYPPEVFYKPPEPPVSTHNTCGRKVLGMSISSDQVRATVQKLTENSQSVDLNVLLDKLMDDGECLF